MACHGMVNDLFFFFSSKNCKHVARLLQCVVESAQATPLVTWGIPPPPLPEQELSSSSNPGIDAEAKASLYPVLSENWCAGRGFKYKK